MLVGDKCEIKKTSSRVKQTSQVYERIGFTTLKKSVALFQSNLFKTLL